MPRQVELPEYVGMLRRTMAAAGRRGATCDPEDLALLVGLRADLEAAITAAVHGLHDQGRSYADIAAPLGVTRQAVHAQYGGTRATVGRVA